MEGKWGFLEVDETRFTGDHICSFRSWLLRMSVATWIWVRWLSFILGKLSPIDFRIRGRQENGTPTRSLLHLLCLRSVPEDSRRRCSIPRRRAAQVNLRVLTSPGLIPSPQRLVWQCLGHWGGGEKETKEGLIASTRKEWRGLRSKPLLSCYPLQRGPAAGASTPWI